MLAVIQNFETLANDRAAEVGPESSREAKAAPQPAPTAGDAEGSPQTRRARLSKAMRQVHLPPVATQISTFQQKETAESSDEDDEGIRYVDKLHVVGGLLGTALKADGEFVGTPTVQWMRQRSSGGTSGDEFVPIPYATGLEYMPNADDVGAREIVSAPPESLHASREGSQQCTSCTEPTQPAVIVRSSRCAHVDAAHPRTANDSRRRIVSRCVPPHRVRRPVRRSAGAGGHLADRARPEHV